MPASNCLPVDVSQGALPLAAHAGETTYHALQHASVQMVIATTQKMTWNNQMTLVAIKNEVNSSNLKWLLLV